METQADRQSCLQGILIFHLSIFKVTFSKNCSWFYFLQGVWVHPEIDNPEYAADATIGKYDEVCIAGFDLWQVKSGTIFDNLLISDDADAAKKVLK